MQSFTASLLNYAKETLNKGFGLSMRDGQSNNRDKRGRKSKGTFKFLETPMPNILAEAQALIDNLPALQGPDRGQQTHNLSGGIHGRRKAGSGDDFWQFRTYSTGDNIRSIDWRRSARGDNLYIRQNEWQTSEDIWFWCDPSASMVYRSDKSLPSKSDCAHLLALSAASLYEQGGERLGVLNAHDKPTAGRFGLTRLAEGFEINRQDAQDAQDALVTQNESQGTTPLPTTPPRLGALASNAHIILVSDFLCEETDLLNTLKALSTNGVQGHLVHIIDPAEVDFPFTGRTLFKGLEQEGNHLSPRAEDFKHGYQTLMGGWMDTVRAMARHAGWGYSVQRTDESITKTLLYLAEQSDGLKGTRSTARSTGRGSK
jgi:uncharacterized protein (DUF58 family)